jgi:hypothetical protein
MRTLWFVAKTLALLIAAAGYLYALVVVFFILKDPGIRPMFAWLALPFAIAWLWVLWPDAPEKIGKEGTDQ